MVGTESSDKQIFMVKFLVIKEKNKVVLAEAGKDFVDVLFSFLAMPMETIVRLLENQKSQAATTIGCFNNLYKSVVDMSKDDFLTDACKHIILYLRYLKERQYRRFKLNIDDTEDLKYYRCPNLGTSQSCSEAYSNFCSLRCSCGELMAKEIKGVVGSSDEIFVSQKTFFIMTKNMKVDFASISMTMKTLRGLGYKNLDNMEAMFVDVGHKEVLALLECLSSSDTPLTDVFLRKQNSCIITRTLNTPSLAGQDRDETESNEVLSITVFVWKQDKKILYMESGQDFVDLLFIFLVVPLELVWETSGSNIELGCIENFSKSMKSLCSSEGTNPSSFTCVLPWNYRFQAPLLDVCCKINLKAWSVKINSRPYVLKMMSPNYDGSGESTVHCRSGLVRRDTTYMISDDLTITSTKSSSTFCIMKKWGVDLDDIEVHVINISKTEASSLLRASLMTSTALTTALGSLLPKKPKEEKL
ncbi:unnamed protein product [Arabis nemorensis]|uniref:DUF674 domain-containing protein n=1 Tax=Arabis nemorensis TaxID=586526 RepID=A0A565ANC9_9BRAS|nr:unnamed protein product [Arabis nemorensis]